MALFQHPAIASLATTRAGRPERRTALCIALGMLVVALLAICFGRDGAAVVPSFLPIVIGAIIATELVSAYVFFSQFLQSGRASLVALAAAYFIPVLLIAGYILTFPGIFAANGLFGANEQTAYTLWILWHCTFPIGVIVSGLLDKNRLRIAGTHARHVVLGVATFGFLSVAAVVWFASVHSALLPTLVLHRHFLPASLFVILPVICILDIIALTTMVLQKGRTAIHVWIPVAVLASMLDAVMGVISNRYSLVWYTGKVFSVAASSIMVAVFINEITRLYQALASANAELKLLRKAEQDAAQAALGAAEERLALSQEVAHLGTWESDLQTRLMSWSPSLYDITGIVRGTPVYDTTYTDLLHADDRATFFHSVERARYSGRPVTCVHRIRRITDGALRWVEGRAQFIYDERGAPTRAVGIALDITDRKQAEEHALYLANHDSLTDLPNRAFLVDRLRSIIVHSQGQDTISAVMAIGVDRFKLINATYGHDAGDTFLRLVAQRLADYVGEGSVLARTSDDEFVMILTGLDSPKDVVPTAQRILTRVRRQCELGGRTFSSDASIGISIFPSDGKVAEELLRDATSVMQQVKASGGNDFQFFTSEMHGSIIRQVALEQDLPFAIERNELYAMYQPIMNLRTHRPASAEALLRWHHPSKGIIGPDEFIPIAERSGIMTSIGEWVWNQALAENARWRNRGYDLPISVNVSMKELHDVGFFDRLSAVIARSGVPPNRMVLEITESTAMSDPELTRSTLERCRVFGMRVALDDFGTHYSSLAYLKQLPVDVIKIDKSFTHDVLSAKTDVAIIRAIMALAEALHLLVVVEGVETTQQLRRLEEVGCEFAQGFLFSKPLVPDAVRLFIKEHWTVAVSASNIRTA